MQCKIKYLSPTSLNMFETAPDKFVLYYVVGIPRIEQLLVMAVGAAFDAHVKGALAEDLLGQTGMTKTLMATNVLPKWQIEADAHGEYLLKLYRSSGAYDKLLQEITRAFDTVGFEFDAKAEIDGVPIFGKPDLYFVRDGIHFVYDWKVSGFLSKASPAPGYSRLLDKNGKDAGAHRDVLILPKYGIPIAAGCSIKNEWHDQITMYSWAMDNSAESEQPWVLGIDMLCIANLLGKFIDYSGQSIRVASYRITRKPRPDLRERLVRAWEAIQAGHYFPTLSRDESDAKVAILAADDSALRWAMEN